MAKYRTIHTTFWDDAKVVDEFTPDDKFLFLYLLTNQKTNQIGCYELPFSQIVRDTGLKKQKIEKILQNLEKNLKVIVYDDVTKEIFIKNWYKYNWLNSSLTKKCIEKEYDLIKSDKLKGLISPLYGAYIVETSPIEEIKRKEKEKEYKNKRERKEKEKEASSEAPSSFPTLAEIISYASNELKISDKTFCEKFFNHYQSIGWVSGTGQAIQDWKATFNKWAIEDKLIPEKKEKEYIEIDENGNLIKVKE